MVTVDLSDALRAPRHVERATEAVEAGDFPFGSVLDERAFGRRGTVGESKR